jgi:hypothetical protein
LGKYNTAKEETDKKQQVTAHEKTGLERKLPAYNEKNRRW